MPIVVILLLVLSAAVYAQEISVLEPEQPETEPVPALTDPGPADTELSQTPLKPAAPALPAPPAAAAQPPSADQATVTEPPQTVAAAELSRDEPLARRERAYRQFLKLYDDGNYEQSIFFANEVVNLTRDIFGNRAIELANPEMNLAGAYRSSGDTQSAQATYSAAIEIIEDNDGFLSAELINPLIGLGATYNDAGQHDLALRAYRRALHVNHVNAGFYNFEQIPVRDGLTESYLGLEELERADFEQTVQVSFYEHEYGQNNPVNLPAMYKLADWYHHTGQFKNEQSIYTNTLRMIKRSGGKTDPLLVETYRRYAALYRRQELARSGGETDPLLVDTYRRYAALSRRQELTRSGGETDPLLVDTYRRQELAEEAIRMQKKAIEINEAQPEPNITLRGDLLVELGDWYSTFGYSRHAVQSYSEAWQTFAADPELYGERLEAYFSRPQSVFRRAIPTIYPRSSRNLDPASNPNIFGDGIVMARYTVTDRGRVEDVEIIESDPPDLLDDKVASALRHWYFRPEFQDGLPVSRPNMTYVHEFKYDKTALRIAEEEKSDKQEHLPNPNEMDSGSSGALGYLQ